MDPAARIRRLRRALRRRERAAVAAYLAVTAAAVALTCAPPLRDPVLDKVEWLTVRAGDRWTLRVEAAEAELAEALDVADPSQRDADLERVIGRLRALDDAHPARHVKHARDAERVRLLRALVRAEQAHQRKGRALDAVRRLVAFDPRRYASHLLHAEIATTFAEDEEAAAAWREVLAIDPDHLAGVQAVVEMHAETGDWAATTAAFERYLEALRLEPVTLQVGGRAVAHTRLPADGRWHPVDLPVPGTAGEGAPSLAAELPLEVRRLEAVPARRAGAWPGDAPPGPIARVRGVVRVRKTVPAGLWEVVARAYRNQLRRGALEAARARVVVLPEAAS